LNIVLRGRGGVSVKVALCDGETVEIICCCCCPMTVNGIINMLNETAAVAPSMMISMDTANKKGVFIAMIYLCGETILI
jgi:hypothetical protein